VIYKIVFERFPLELEKSVNQALADGYELWGTPFGFRDSLHQAVIKREEAKAPRAEEKNRTE
jgi:hypothetical protein